MHRDRAHRRIIIGVALLIGLTAVGVSFAVSNGHDTVPAVRPYDPMPRW